MNRIIEILMKRDNLSLNEATNLFEEVQNEVMEAIANGDGLLAIENIIADELGLEPDYFEDLIM